MKKSLELRQKRAKLIADMGEYTAKASKEGRSLNAEEKEAFDRMLAEEKELRSTIEAIDAQEGLERSLDEATEQRDRQNANGQETADQAFEAHVRSKGRIPFEYRDNLKGSATSGGDIVPTGFYNQLIVALKHIDGPFNVGRMITTETGVDLPVPTNDNTASRSAATAEGATQTGTDRVFGQSVLKAYKYPAIVTLSDELLNDNGVNIQAELASLLSVDIADGLNTDLTVGDGSNKPTGFVSAATAIAAGAAATVSYNDLVNLKYGTNKAYRQNAIWMMNDTTFGDLIKLADSQGRPLIYPASAGADDILFGQRVCINNAMADVGASAKSIAYGDFGNKYVVRQVRGVQFKVSTEVAFMKDGVVFKATLRADGKLAVAKAVSILTHPAS
jgi:HK97 family phage major capsid protein